MIARFFRRNDARRRSIETLHTRINAASRVPALYTGLGVPDTVEGRFECLVLHVYLVLRRLKALPPPAAEIAQDLVNSVFQQLDASLRELGVGDLGVSKRMKKLGQAFYGRTAGYDAGLDANDPAVLRAALARNVLGCEESEVAAGLAAYVVAADAALARADTDALMGAGPAFPEPAASARDAVTRKSVSPETGAQP